MARNRGRVSIWSLLLSFFLQSCIVAAIPTSDFSMSALSVLHTRQYFYVGGQYQDVNGTGDAAGQIKVGQIYVEALSPASIAQPYPIIFWTGNGQTGANWLNTPDNRPGWASYFLSKGYRVYLADQTQRGRSAWDTSSNTSFSTYTAQYCAKYWTDTHNSADLWPQASLHTQFPGSGQLGDPTFDAFYASQVPALSNRTQTEDLAREALTALLDKIGPAFLLTHSQGGPHGFLAADSRPDLLKGLMSIEPEGPPFVNEIRGVSGEVVRPYGVTITEIGYEPPLAGADELRTAKAEGPAAGLTGCTLQIEPARKLKNIAEVPMLLLTSEAGYHAAYDYCTVEYLKQAGVNVTWLNLPDIGVKGNGHFMFMELNNLEIAAHIDAWLSTQST